MRRQGGVLVLTGKPRLLDLYCGEGGAAKGYQRAGFYVVGVDHRPQPRYCGDLFVQANALRPPFDLREFDAIHASPPCQGYSWSAKRWAKIPRAFLVDATRDMLKKSDRPYIIENVIGAPLQYPVLLCGEMFGLGVIRHRLFESNVLLFTPDHVQHDGTVRDGSYVTVAGHGGDNIKGRGSRRAKQEAMGIDWMTDKGLNEAIPPVYTEWIGERILATLQGYAALDHNRYSPAEEVAIA